MLALIKHLLYLQASINEEMGSNSTASFLNEVINISSNPPGCNIHENQTDIDFYKAHIPTIMNICFVLQPIWWFVGIIGNTVALLVWLQPKMRHSSGCYLAALAITDLCFLPLNIVFEINHSYINKESGILDKPILCEWFVITYLSVQYMSPVLVLAFTVERYLSVCHPFRMVNFNQSNVRVTVFVILGLVLFCFGLNAVQGYFWTTDHANGSRLCNVRAEVLESGAWSIVAWVAEMLIFAAVPLTVLILNILVIVEVRNISSLERRNMQPNSIDSRSTTFMLLGVSFYLILTVLPVTVMYVLYSNYKDLNRLTSCLTDEEMDDDPAYSSYFHYLGARLIIQNIGISHYAANFFIYLGTGKLFRKQLKEMCVTFCCKQKLSYLTSKAGNTRMTRMSLTSHRGSVGRGRLSSAKANSDPCNNDTELGNKNASSAYSCAEAELSTMNGGHSVKHNGAAGSRLLTCVEESDADLSDKEDSPAMSAVKSAK